MSPVDPSPIAVGATDSVAGDGHAPVVARRPNAGQPESRVDLLDARARNPTIDVVRGVSVLLVVMHHMGLRVPLRSGVLASLLPRWFLSALIYNGYEAVFIFFVVSGFLITSRSLARWGRLRSVELGAFYGLRASRILPCLLLLLLVLSGLHLLGVTDYVIAKPSQSLPRALLAALGLHLNWYEGRTGYLPGGWDVLWSLSIEELFYIVFPLVCRIARRESILAACLAVFALSLPLWRARLGDNEIWQEKAYLPGMAAISTGVVGALVAARMSSCRRSVTRALTALGVLGIAAVLFVEDRLWAILGNGTMLVLTLSTLCLLLGSQRRAPRAPLRGARSTAWLRLCGRLSYEIYLTHMLVVLLVVRVYRALGAHLYWGALFYVPAVVLSSVLGFVVARWFSVPSERRIRRWLALRR